MLFSFKKKCIHTRVNVHARVIALEDKNMRDWFNQNHRLGYVLAIIRVKFRFKFKVALVVQVTHK